MRSGGTGRRPGMPRRLTRWLFCPTSTRTTWGLYSRRRKRWPRGLGSSRRQPRVPAQCRGRRSRLTFRTFGLSTDQESTCRWWIRWSSGRCGGTWTAHLASKRSPKHWLRPRMVWRRQTSPCLPNSASACSRTKRPWRCSRSSCSGPGTRGHGMVACAPWRTSRWICGIGTP